MTAGLTLQERRCDGWPRARHRRPRWTSSGGFGVRGPSGGDGRNRRPGECGRGRGAPRSRPRSISRGEAGRGPDALTPVQWVRRYAPSTRSGGAGQVVAVAEAFSVGGLSPVKGGSAVGRLPVRSAAVVVAESGRLRPLLAEVRAGRARRAPSRWRQSTAPAAVAWCGRGCWRLRPRRRAAARAGPDEAVRGRRSRRVDECGLAEYPPHPRRRGGAALEAALVRCPRRSPSTVSGTCGRATSAEATRSSPWCDGRSRRPTTPRRARRASCSSPSTSRRCAADPWCRRDHRGHGGRHAARTRDRASARLDATIIPTVHGPPRARSSTWVAARACSARHRPGGSGSVTGVAPIRGARCSRSRRMPHHLVHWADGGPSDLDNAALLCERHHTIVHTRRYAGSCGRGPCGDTGRVGPAAGLVRRAAGRTRRREPA